MQRSLEIIMIARFQLDVHPFTDRGSREYQEDFFYTDPPARDGIPWLGAVADGMGGHVGGDLASKAGIHALKLAFDAAIAARRGTADALVEAATRGHEAVLVAAEQANALGNMGSTIAAFAVDGQTLHWCSAGDSRIYLCRDGRLHQLSRDFTLAEDMRQGIKKGDWSEGDIEGSPQRNALTSFMGTDAWRYDSGKKHLQHDDVIVACSDGVYGTIDADGILAACAPAGGAASAQKIAENMQQRVQEVGKPNQDNSTAVVVRVVAQKQTAVVPVDSKAAGSSGVAWLGGGLASVAAMGVAATIYFKGPGPAEVKPAETAPNAVPVVLAPTPPVAIAPVAPLPASAALTATPPMANDGGVAQLLRLEGRINGTGGDKKRLDAKSIPDVAQWLRDDLASRGIQESPAVSKRLTELIKKNSSVVPPKSTAPPKSSGPPPTKPARGPDTAASQPPPKPAEPEPPKTSTPAADPASLATSTPKSASDAGSGGAK